MSESGPRQLDPKVDVVFRALFGTERNVDLLRSLLNGVLDLQEAEWIESVQILTPLCEPESNDDKGAVLDVAVRDARGRRYVVEMQCRSHRGFPERMLYYAARRYGEQLRRGETYIRLEPVVLVIFTGFVLLREHDGWHERFELRGVESGLVFSRHLSVVLVQLPRFRESGRQSLSLGEQWVTFLKEGSAMEPMTREPWVTPELRKAQQELERLAGDEQMRQRYVARLRQVQTWATELEDSYLTGHEQGLEQGLEKGLEQGLEQATIEFARRLLADGETLERVAKLTNLPIQKVRELS